MFIIDDREIPYCDPWTSSLSQRLARLRRSSPRVAYFYEQPDNSTFRYRVYNMIQALAAANSPISASYFSLEDLAHEDHIVESCDALVICRAKYSHAINRLVAKAKARGRKVFFDVDDFIFDTRYAHLIVNTLDQDLAHPHVWDFWYGYIGRIGGTLLLCDHAIVTNAFLADRVRAFNDMPVSVIPNFLNLEQVTRSDAIYEQKTAAGFARDGKIHLGYFSGTPTHNRDFGLICDALAQLMGDDPRLMLRVAGYLPVPEALRKLGDRVEVHAFRDYVNLQTLIGSTEINLIPLQDNVFTACKSELKYFEAAATGTVSIATPTGMLRESIRDGVNGYLAGTFDWADKIYRAVGAIGDYAGVAQVSREHVRRVYHWSEQAKVIERVLMC